MTEWISVKDRLPESKEGRFPSDLVLVYSPDIGVRVGYQHQGEMHIECEYCEDEQITHWMPLPKEPNGVD